MARIRAGRETTVRRRRRSGRRRRRRRRSRFSPRRHGAHGDARRLKATQLLRSVVAVSATVQARAAIFGMFLRGSMIAPDVDDSGCSAPAKGRRGRERESGSQTPEAFLWVLVIRSPSPSQTALRAVRAAHVHRGATMLTDPFGTNDITGDIIASAIDVHERLALDCWNPRTWRA